jgi:Type I phosphodiesterase / nucleotide pyrophosphatase
MPRRVTMVFLVDALGWEIAEHYRFGSTAFARRSSLGTVLGYSSTAIPSLLTGAQPHEHGVFSMFRAARPGGTFAFLRGVPRLPHALDWRARRWVRRWVDRRGGVHSYYDLYDIPVHLLHRFDVAQRADPFQPGGLGCESVFDWMGARGIRYRAWYYTTPEEENFRDAIAALDGDADVLFVYTAELDALMHRVGIVHEAVGAKLARYEAFLADAQQRARECDVTLSIVLLSDHGMTAVTRTVDVWGALTRRGLALGRDYLAFFDSTMARVWGDSEVDAAVADAFGGLGWRLDDAELAALGCRFPGGEYGRSVFLADPGVLIVPSFMGSRPIAAMHGYHPDDRYSRGCFMTTATPAAPASILGFKSYFQRMLDE